MLCNSTCSDYVNAGRTVAVEFAGCDGGVKTDGLLANTVLADVSSAASGYSCLLSYNAFSAYVGSCQRISSCKSL